MATEEERVFDVQEDAASKGGAGAGRAKGGRWKVVIAIVGILAGVAAILAVLFAVGVIWPAQAVAKYGMFSYVHEDEAAAYIEGFKSRSGFAEAADDDEEWLSFLEGSNLTPQALRLKAIDEILKSRMVEQRARELGITVTEEEVQEDIDSLKSLMAFDDDDIWADTLAMYNQTEEGIHEKYRRDILKRKVYTQEVELPEPTDYQVKEYVAYTVPQLPTTQAKHSYCFKITGLDEAGSLAKMKAVQEVRNALAAEGPSAEAFEAVVDKLSDVDSLRETGGGNGWDVDTSEYSEAYVNALEGLQEGGLSGVFTDEDGYAFIWVDQVYELPTTADDLAKLDLAIMPDSLRQYFVDCEARALWKVACDAYAQSLVEAADVLIRP